MAGRARAPAANKGFALPQVPKIAVYLIGFIPAVGTFYAGLMDQLGADPMRTLDGGFSRHQ